MSMPSSGTRRPRQVLHRTVKIDGLDIFYREAGPQDAPTVLLLHGFPTSSHMFRNLIPALADKYHVVAPDYPGFGNSSAPSVTDFDYSFDNLANVIEKFTEKVGLKKYSIYLMDYGAPVGFRLASKHPERVETLIVQNGNAYDEGIDNDFWKPIKAYWKDRSKDKGDGLRSLLTLDATKWQYTAGVRNLETISPDTWGQVQPLWIVPAIKRFNWLCSSVTAATRRCTRSGRNTSATPTADTDRLGQERRNLSGCRSASL
jgi:pimeloyl-ACP methyl ester carboxylesterase